MEMQKPSALLANWTVRTVCSIQFRHEANGSLTSALGEDHAVATPCPRGVGAPWAT